MTLVVLKVFFYDLKLSHNIYLLQTYGRRTTCIISSTVTRVQSAKN